MILQLVYYYVHSSESKPATSMTDRLSNKMTAKYFASTSRAVETYAKYRNILLKLNGSCLHRLAAALSARARVPLSSSFIVVFVAAVTSLLAFAPVAFVSLLCLYHFPSLLS